MDFACLFLCLFVMKSMGYEIHFIPGWVPAELTKIQHSTLDIQILVGAIPIHATIKQTSIKNFSPQQRSRAIFSYQFMSSCQTINNCLNTTHIIFYMSVWVPWSQRFSFAAKRRDKGEKEAVRENLWKRAMRISLSCCDSCQSTSQDRLTSNQ